MAKKTKYISTFLIIILIQSPYVLADKDIDSDGDGLTDKEESHVFKTDPHLTDTDNDGLADGLEVKEYWTLPLVSDTDGDGYLDGVEVRMKTDPLEADSHPDPRDQSARDLDGDGLTNQEEEGYGTNPQLVDSDFDGLNDDIEIRVYFTDPLLTDTDGDGVWDGEEINGGSDPLNPYDQNKLAIRPNSGKK